MRRLFRTRGNRGSFLRRRGRGFRLWRRGRWGLAWLRRLSFFEQRGPLVGQIHFLNFCFRRGCGTSQFLVRKSGGALEAAAQFRKALGAALVAGLGMNLFELRSQFGGAAVVAGAENKIEKFFEGGGMTRGAAQNGLEQSDGLLRETVAGKQVYVGERLCDESLRLLVQLRIEWRGRSLRPVCDFRTEPAYIGAQLGRGSLGYFGSQMILGNSGDFVRDIGCRRQAQLAQNVIEFAFHRIAVGLALD